MKRLFLSTNRQQEIYSCADLSPENIDKLINFEPINGDIILIDGKNNPDHGIEMLLYFIFDTCQKASIFEARFKIVLIGDRALEVYLRDYTESSPLFHI